MLYYVMEKLKTDIYADHGVAPRGVASMNYVADGGWCCHCCQRIIYHYHVKLDIRAGGRKHFKEGYPKFSLNKIYSNRLRNL